MSTIEIQLPPKLIPVFLGPARVRGSYGGRGSAKTRSFAKMSAVIGAKAAQERRDGILLCMREYMNSLDDSSMSEVKAAIASEEWLSDVYEVGEKFIRTRDKRVEYKFAGLRHNLDSIKSKARILLGWVDEADPVSEDAWAKLIPTIREEDSELWVTWNPERMNSATDKRFRNPVDDDIRIVELNWRDNPWFPSVLERERLRDKRDRADQYDHIWEGGYKTVFEGAYYTQQLREAREQGRICRLAADPLLRKRAYFDIGGSGATADLNTIWVAQPVAREQRVLDYIAGKGQVLSYYVNELRQRGHGDAIIVLPHDGMNSNNFTGQRYRDHWVDAGFDVQLVPNQGRGAAMQRIHAARRLFPRIWFNDTPAVQQGIYHLAAYHSNTNDLGADLGPEHDEHSHASDAFGLMCVHYAAPVANDDDYADDYREVSRAGY